MSKSQLNPPYIEAAVYAHDRREEHLFEQVASTLLNSAQARVGYVELAPLNQYFEMPSDLADIVERVELDKRHPREISHFQRKGKRVLEAGLVTPTLGPVAIKYSSASVGDRHPISIISSANELGIPLKHLSPSKLRVAQRRGRRWQDVFKLVCDATRPLYGQISIEQSLSTPQDFLYRNGNVRGDFYLSRELIGSDGRNDFFDMLESTYGKTIASSWRYGRYVSGWAPFNPSHSSVDDQRRLHSLLDSYLADRLVRFTIS